MEVLIIGAGVAGLAAAQSLTAAGVKPIIVEARDRIGGRVWTVRAGTAATPVELGAEFIHGKPPHLLEAVESARLVIQPVSGRHEYLRDGCTVSNRELLRGVDEVFKALPDVPDQTFSEFFKQRRADPETCRLATNYVEGFNAARADRISTRSLAFESQAQDAIGGDQSFRFEDGYDRLPEWLWDQSASHAELKLSTVVEKIEWRRGYVSVTARSASEELLTVTAHRAIVTLPLPILQSPETGRGAVRLHPRPPRLDDALALLEMGQAVRVTFLLSASFWRDHRQLGDAGFIHTDAQAFPTWWTTLPGPSRGLTAWAGGSRIERIVHLNDEEIAAKAINSLAGILRTRRNTVAGQVESWHLHNWSNDPFARGAYSYARVGGLDARQQLAMPVEDTLYFAGEATDTEGHAATVHGAMASGRRAAQQILEAC